ncbi:uncharacterized protein PFLUO_LOCUS6089 [Penicillium psychrofluorescens]|uniref:uncharacterized protein n=1 Tax=Penicillium psychrofluorescens TaxID=3158075 RepID=UPI003CCD179B
MSNIIHKVKDAVTNHGSSDNNNHHNTSGTGSANAYDSPQSSNHGPHNSNMTNAADPRIDSDRSKMTGGTYNPGTTSTAGGNTVTGVPHSTHQTATGAHQSNLANQADPRIDNTRSHMTGPAYNTGTTGTAAGNTVTGVPHSTHQTTTGVPHSTHQTATGPTSTTAGVHRSNIANQADPRIDSTGSHVTGPAYNTGTTGTRTGNTVTGVPHSTHQTTTGAHHSNIANQADPRIGGDLRHGTAGTAGTAAPYGGVSTHSAATGPAPSTAGPHKSNMLNEADPRVDSDMSKERNQPIGSGRFDQDVHKSSIGGAGVMHGMGGSGGPTSTKTFEQAQEHGAVDHGAVGHGAVGHGAAGSSYNTSNKKTVGPHSSDMANKMDPRVDSNADGSKTIGSQRV